MYDCVLHVYECVGLCVCIDLREKLEATLTSSTHTPDSVSGLHRIMVLSIEADSSFMAWCLTPSSVGEGPAGGKVEKSRLICKYKKHARQTSLQINGTFILT